LESMIGDVSTSVLGGFTFVLGFLLVFRTQKAYDRWWEGGSLLQDVRGEWFNAYSSLLAFCNQSKDQQKVQDVLVFQHFVARLFSLLYASALKQVTTMEPKKFELLNLDGFDHERLDFIQNCHDSCEVTLQWIQQLIVDANGKETIKVAPPILSRVYNQLGNGIVKVTAARKIARYPPPFPLTQMISIMLFFHCFMTALLCASAVKNVIWAWALTFVVIMSYMSINYIATELEMPYGTDANDLPLIDMQREFNESLKQLMHPSCQLPHFVFNSHIHGALNVKELDLERELTTAYRLKEDVELINATAHNSGAVPPVSIPTEKKPLLGKEAVDPRAAAAKAVVAPALFGKNGDCVGWQSPSHTQAQQLPVEKTDITDLGVKKCLTVTGSASVQRQVDVGGSVGLQKLPPEMLTVQVEQHLSNVVSELQFMSGQHQQLYGLHCDFYGLLCALFEKMPSLSRSASHSVPGTPFAKDSSLRGIPAATNVSCPV